MVEIITPVGLSLNSLEVRESNSSFADGSGFDHPSDQLDFQAMVESDEFGDSSVMPDSSQARNGILQLAHNVDQSKANMQSALLQASITSDAAVIQRATTALSRYDLQTLFLSKVANKAFQAVDRLTNLQ